jgi:HD-GYP domain-containing protein (c-di-GMP phosphodiesterase class II)
VGASGGYSDLAPVRAGSRRPRLRWPLAQAIILAMDSSPVKDEPTSPSLSPLRSALRRVDKLNAVLEVAKAMAAEHNLDTLLPLILREAARVVEADRCSLFILDRARGELWSRVAQGAKGEIRVPLGQGIAGAVALSGQVVNLRDAYLDPRFQRDWDSRNDYRTSSVLCVPMRDTRGDVTGVLQALNATDGGFDGEDEELLLALGGQAAQAIENAMLHEEISRLFEGFVQASVMAIESRDPTTAGHSGRVASLTVQLAQATEQSPAGPYRDLRFSAEQIQELRYASLLHDFGKIGVREPVLVKAEKLYPQELEVLKQRFELARKDRQLASMARRVDAVRVRGERELEAIEAEETARLAADLRELDEALEFILQCNRPTVLAQGGFEKLSGLGSISFTDSRERTAMLLSPTEVQVLSITRGSLSPSERKEIESHVTHTFRFLSQIPWTRSLKRVPEIAHAHHEKLDGKGYPRAIASDVIPVQSKMMAISDIYDALTASDRPYKKAMPHELALDIIGKEATSGQLDEALFRVFVEAEVPRRALKPR